MLKKLLSLTFCLSIIWQLQGQRTLNQMARDTIVQLPGFMGKTYLLDGKELNLPVMEWFMSDYPEAYNKIRVAVVTDQVSILSYSFGGLFGLTGLLIHPKDAGFGNDLLKIGGACVGSGIIFQIISASFQKKAVGAYNEEIKNLYKTHAVGVQAGLNENGLSMGLKFN